MFCFVDVRSVLTEKTMFDNAGLMFTSIFISKSQKYWLMLPAFAKHTIFYLLLFISSKLQHKQKCDGDFWIITKTQKIKCVTTSKKAQTGCTALIGAMD